MGKNISKLRASVLINEWAEVCGRAMGGRWGKNFVVRAHSDMNCGWYEIKQMKISWQNCGERCVAQSDKRKISILT